MTVEEVSRPIVLVLSQLQTELFKSRSSIDLLVKTVKNTTKQPFLPVVYLKQQFTSKSRNLYKDCMHHELEQWASPFFLAPATKSTADKRQEKTKKRKKNDSTLAHFGLNQVQVCFVT